MLGRRNPSCSSDLQFFLSVLKGVSFSATTCVNNSFSLNLLKTATAATDDLGEEARTPLSLGVWDAGRDLRPLKFFP